MIFWLLLSATFAVRAIHPGQPIVENYVGRQIPTAMVARNLERGSGFFRPELDTGPFPNLFLVEPPIYAGLVVALRPMLGFELEPSGRLVSALATAVGAWGLFGLVRRRQGISVAFLAMASFGIFPVMVRYGRAFQPDALMIGCVLAGLRGWDEYEASGRWRWAVFGGFVLAMGLAVKITVAWALLPFVLILTRWPLAWRLAAAIAMLLPAFSWYLYAWENVASSQTGSLASTQNASLWLSSVSPSAWLRLATYEFLLKGLAVRSFTPVGFVLAIYGLLACGKLDRLWVGWAVGCGLAILGLASKWHHAYYWMAVAPLAALGVARGLDRLWKMGKAGRPIAGMLGSFLLALCLVQSISTWQTPVEWRGLRESARELAAQVPVSDEKPIIAPEALLYYADRRGCRLEFDPLAIRRAAAEWGKSIPDADQPLALVHFYRQSVAEPSERPVRYWFYAGISMVADSGPVAAGSRRAAFRAALRESPEYRILVDRPDLILAEPR